MSKSKETLLAEDESILRQATAVFCLNYHGEVVPFPMIVSEIRKLACELFGHDLSPEYVTTELVGEFWGR